jgi:hypothetical protein
MPRKWQRDLVDPLEPRRRVRTARKVLTLTLSSTIILDVCVINILEV